MPRNALAQQLYVGQSAPIKTVGEYDATTGAAINANFITGLNCRPSDSRCRATTSSWRTDGGTRHGWRIQRHHGSRDQRQLHHGAYPPRRDSPVDVPSPEPSTWSMIAVGGVALLGIMHRKRHRIA